MCSVTLVSSDSSTVRAGVQNVSKSASTATHQQLFRVIAINNRMRKSRLGHDNWSEGWSFLIFGVAVLHRCIDTWCFTEHSDICWMEQMCKLYVESALEYKMWHKWQNFILQISAFYRQIFSHIITSLLAECRSLSSTSLVSKTDVVVGFISDPCFALKLMMLIFWLLAVFHHSAGGQDQHGLWLGSEEI